MLRFLCFLRLSFIFLSLGVMTHVQAANVGLLVMATGKYIDFVPPLIQSAKKHFCRNHNVTYFIFTDGLPIVDDDVVCIYQKRLGWPYDTMMRFHAYMAQRKFLLNQDYLFACDADMLFVDEVGDEILGQHVATLHPGFVGTRGSYETNPRSKAYVSSTEGKAYFAGAFYGGTAEEVIKLCRICASRVNQDLAKGIIAVWHDESHRNRYCIDYPPTLVLSPSYCYPESFHVPFPKKLLALNKNHKKLREQAMTVAKFNDLDCGIEISGPHAQIGAGADDDIAFSE